MANIKVGLVGLGRLGMTHATNIATKIPQMELTAVCSKEQHELDIAKEQLNISETYLDYKDMLHKADIDAIIIASPSGLHCQQIQLAMKAGLHVFCEKPIGLTIDKIQKTMNIIQQYPKQIFMLGFMRRYDESYQYAKKMIDNNELGELTVIRCYGIDPSSSLESFVTFASNNDSGGIFADMAVHDIDLIRWFSNSEVHRVWSLGKNAAYPKLTDIGEVETSATMMELSNQTMVFLLTGRNAIHGYHVETELIGTKGMLRIGAMPEKNLVTIYNDDGVVRPCSQNFPERFGKAFINEMEEFAQCILTESTSPITALDGLKATEVASACQQSIEQNTIITLKKENINEKLASN